MTKRIFTLLVPLTLAAAVLEAVWFLELAANPGPPGFRLDDAWIHMVYGRGLLENGYLAYNDGIPSTGCTSPLWAVCLAILHALSGRGGAGTVVPAVLVFGMALHVACVTAGVALARRTTGSPLAGAAAGCAIALATPLAAAAYSGMEVLLTGTLLLLGTHLVLDRAWGRAGLVLALAGLARPEAGAVTVLLAGLSPFLVDPPSRRGAARRLILPSVVAGALLAAHHLWASSSPLPATFHAKSSVSLVALPARLATALREMFPGIPPFWAGLGWLALLGLFPWSRRRPARPARELLRSRLPLLAGATFLLSNLLVIDPVDPAAFYHLRYVLPAVPLLLVALAVGAWTGTAHLGGPAALAPTFALIALSGIGALRTTRAESFHLHNDVRNINEVQRRIGGWLAEHVPPGRWIAASDAGAVRYFSNMPTIDVIGLNTPEMLAPDESFLREHRVAAIALMPAWFRPVETDRLEVGFRATTEDYTVTSNPAMATQVVLIAKEKAGAVSDSGPAHPTRVRFVGFHPFELDVLPFPGPETEASRGGSLRESPASGRASP